MAGLLFEEQADHVIGETASEPGRGHLFVDPGQPAPCDRLFKPVRQLNAKVPFDLADLIDRCMAFNPPGRPGRMSEVQGAHDVMVEKKVTQPDQRLEAFEID